MAAPFGSRRRLKAEAESGLFAKFGCGRPTRCRSRSTVRGAQAFCAAREMNGLCTKGLNHKFGMPQEQF